ncbi:MAG TPA: hypothetical protein VN258_01940 [Mobilitalea sp.]|nr:hypothetical protein [Mobilitalea sp.]
MSFGYLSLPMWLLLCLLISIYMVFTGIKRRKNDRKALIITYFIIALGALLIALDKLVNEVFIQFKQYSQYISFVIIGLLVFILGNLIYMGITNKGNEHSRKLFKIALLITIFSVVPLILWIIIDLALQNRL